MKCYCCGEDKSEEMFTKDKSNSRGFHGYCKKCKYSKARNKDIVIIKEDEQE